MTKLPTNDGSAGKSICGTNMIPTNAKKVGKRDSTAMPTTKRLAGVTSDVNRMNPSCAGNKAHKQSP